MLQNLKVIPITKNQNRTLIEFPSRRYHWSLSNEKWIENKEITAFFGIIIIYVYVYI